MNILCIGGGPAGLYFALLMKQLNPRHRVTVVERNKPYDTFGWGVVFSDATMDNMREWDPVTAAEIEKAFNHWDDIELHFKGEVIRSGGHGFVGIGRKKLLNILQARCEQLGVDLVFETDVVSDADFPEADLIIASDGINSNIRTRHQDVFKPDIVVRPNRYIWLGTHKQYDAFTFLFEKTEHGWFQAHIYKFDENTTTFIVECPEHVWQAHGLDRADQAESIAFCEKLFAGNLQGEKLMTNARHLRGSAWLNFQRVKCEQWAHFNGRSHVVLMGDAVHTAHFAIGSGTKLAIEDAIELTRQFRDLGDTPAHIPEVLARYQALRSVEALKLQNAAWNAMAWFEVCGLRYCDRMAPPQFMYSMLTRSQRISHENLRLRDRQWLEDYEAWFSGGPVILPMLTPLKVRDLTLHNRIVVSPMATYSAVEGTPQDFHLVHLGARALGGAALVMVEMTSPTPEGRITPRCTGLWNDEQTAAFKRICRFVHGQGTAKIGLQLGHSGPKGSTQVGWEQTDEPLKDGNWPLLAASAVPYGTQNQVPHAMTRVDMDLLTQQFVAATQRAVAAGFDWLELHCAHGYLLSSFITPLTNLRTDEYGGDITRRCRYPLEVFRAMRAVWPTHLPMSVRISAHDWAPGGNTDDDAVVIAKLFKDAGCDLIDVSSGQTTRDARPVYGRMYQTPFADRIRNEVGIQTIAVGAISEADHANSIIAAGRADLCAIARPHLADPAWTLHEAAKLQTQAVAWPRQYLSGRDQLDREVLRQKQALALANSSQSATISEANNRPD
ncbi:MAG: bifunctional salicylyl-CoA 5-hydroxylase/oxidoreductase [Burkholderiaceae bacterium]|uniref:bifunctional salicylyl-CoA 5-hydroxylase/oxidoreductase n=1 Tax=Hydrogenophaga sp. TaxID=1904254 RepID=UPI00277077C4|nr:bifunctional salicylyl-CoA 5-hydroxylase/oxidoreductase [Hydrogenophaga sp.]MDP2065945.1 bifunctional salicylyl-CoA 5-hydroxylase/oxidoreductase [Burkholderiaceae bacterium]MDZ4144054.1 bifunctional salicylyl-CoA 5-hydroxylase/oxidoreductase [Burkholderiales bacterium]MDZ4398879.1 bifunctional salicylyl-CoA 5-hydroxylase/oxidoreductase [Hydrogenophaga sp.]